MKYAGQNSVTKLIQLVKNRFDALSITRDKVIAGQVTSTITIPFTVPNTSNLLVYYNGILMDYGEHYTVNASNQLILANYNTEIGDVISFVYHNM